MAKQEEHYSIGKVAKLYQISIDQLRNYDKIGLLRPEGRGENNYRYYTERQLEELLIIKELKRIGIPLKLIAEFLQKRDLNSIRETLEENRLLKRIELEEKQKQYDELIDTILLIERAMAESHLQKEHQEMNDQAFRIVPIAERPIVSIRKKSLCYKEQHYTNRYVELQNLIEETKLAVGRSWFILYHDPFDCIFNWGEEAEGDMEFFVNLKYGNTNHANCRMFGGFMAACATYSGSFVSDNHEKLYHDLTDWAQSLGYHTNGISYQEQLIGRNSTNNEEDFLTKIYLPLDVNEV